jgi:hypothetical protein
MSEHLYCVHVRENGTSCRAMASKASGYCYYHDPATEQERITGIRASAAPADRPPVLQEEVALETVPEIQAVMRRLANYLATAPNPDTARA